jgi:hypothetical protein
MEKIKELNSSFFMRYTPTHRHKEAKDMATKKKVEQPANDELQQILEHFGENSAEYAEAKAKAEAE